MLRSSKRLTTSLVKEVVNKGKIFHSPVFVLKALKNKDLSRFSISVSKKVAKNAVDRNKIRRRMSSILRTLYSSIYVHVDGVFLMKLQSKEMSFKELKNEVQSSFVKFGFIK
ncbi:MAG TPA: ribonuclease P protein component [Candidatus Paceibacterota bacterium]